MMRVTQLSFDSAEFLMFLCSDKDGQITEAEFAAVGKGVLKSHMANASDEDVEKECKRRFKSFDQDGNGKVSWNEFWMFFIQDSMIPDVVTWQSTVDTLKTYGMDVSAYVPV
jgi:Ca2+-binding EF-hand superfamily protein